MGMTMEGGGKEVTFNSRGPAHRAVFSAQIEGWGQGLSFEGLECVGWERTDDPGGWSCVFRLQPPFPGKGLPRRHQPF